MNVLTAQKEILHEVNDSIKDYQNGFLTNYDIVRIWGNVTRSLVANPVVSERREELTHILFEKKESEINEIFNDFDIEKFNRTIQYINQNPDNLNVQQSVLKYVDTLNSLLLLKTIHITLNIHSDYPNLDISKVSFNPLDSREEGVFDLRNYVPLWVFDVSSKLSLSERLIMENAEHFTPITPFILSMGVFTFHPKHKPNIYHYLGKYLFEHKENNETIKEMEELRIKIQNMKYNKTEEE